MNSREKTSQFSLNPSDGGSLEEKAVHSEHADVEDHGINLGKLNLPKIISFDSIARCGDEVWIESDGKIYRLRKTKQGKLILTK